MMFRWTNKQPEIQNYWNLWGHYQDIYDWILPPNKRSVLPFMLTQQSVGRNESDKSGHLSIFTSLKPLMVLLRCKFFKASCLLYITDSMYGQSTQILFYEKTLLSNAFKGIPTHLQAGSRSPWNFFYKWLLAIEEHCESFRTQNLSVYKEETKT